MRLVFLTNLSFSLSIIHFYISLVSIEKRVYPIPFRTRQSSSSSPMILHTFVWESRPMPRFSLERPSNDGLSFFKPTVQSPVCIVTTHARLLLYPSEKQGRWRNLWLKWLEGPRNPAIEQPRSKNLGRHIAKPVSQGSDIPPGDAMKTLVAGKRITE